MLATHCSLRLVDDYNLFAAAYGPSPILSLSAGRNWSRVESERDRRSTKFAYLDIFKGVDTQETRKLLGCY